MRQLETNIRALRIVITYKELKKELGMKTPHYVGYVVERYFYDAIKEKYGVADMTIRKALDKFDNVSYLELKEQLKLLEIKV